MDNPSMKSSPAGKPQDRSASKPINKGARLRQACIDAVDGDELLFVDGHDDAIIGVAEREGEVCVAYDQAKVIRVLRRRDGMDKAGATEFFEYNIVGSWLGPEAPIFIRRL